jgi:hypothetical protein
MEEVVSQRLGRSFGLYRDLLESIGADSLGLDLPGLASNTIGAQLWCVVGARESYARAIEAGRWTGFSCSLDDHGDIVQVGEALARAAAAVQLALDGLDDASRAQAGLIVDLLEHEAAHQGQLIRYLYARRLSIPASWRERYALD